MENRNIWDGSRVRHDLVNFALELLENIGSAAKLPEEIRQRDGAGIRSCNANDCVRYTIVYRRNVLQVTHALRDDIMIRHGFI